MPERQERLPFTGGRSPGQAITYDAIGNPTNYRGRQHYWSGRDLNTVVVASAGAVAIAFFANENQKSE